MKILFLHRNFPAQFRHIVPALANHPSNEVVFICSNHDTTMPNVKMYTYKLKREIPDDCHRYLRFVEESLIHAQSAAEVALALKQQGFYPDIIYGHTWGQTMFMKDIFPESKLLCYFEWFYKSMDSDMGFDGRTPTIDDLAKLRTKNAHLLIDLYSCDKGLCPTKFQASQFPKEFKNKIKILHDGVDTEFCTRDDDAKFVVDKDGKQLTFTQEDEVVTYATRGMEAYRGFPQFMKSVEILLKERPKLNVIIAGEDRVCYGPKLADTTYKKYMLEHLDLDLNRVHFVGGLPFGKYVDLLRISSAHVYLTYPFVCSWSLLDSMACECPIVASNTPPVVEFLEDKKSALLFDFFNITKQVDAIRYALDNKGKLENMRKAARKTIVDKYALKDLLPKHVKYLESILNGK